MTDDPPCPEREQAEAWFARLLAPDCSDSEREAFERWRRGDRRNAEAWTATERVWGMFEGLENDEVVGAMAAEALLPGPERVRGQAPATVPGSVPLQASGRRPGRRRTPLRRWFAGAATAAVVAVAAVVAWFTLPGLQPGPALLYQTGAKQDTVELADGSSLRLDIDSQVAVRMTRGVRALELRQGRAIFDVAHEPGRSFMVRAGQVEVTAIGTRFQVDRLGDRIVVTLDEGAVSVAAQDDGGDGASTLRLAPGEQAAYDRGSGWTRRDVDAEAVTSWSSGFHVFSATPLGEAVAEINRYSPRKLRLAEPALEALELSGSFRIGNAASIARVLPAVLAVQVDEDGDDIVVSRRP